MGIIVFDPLAKNELDEAVGCKLIKLIECTELTLAKTMLAKIQMVKLFNLQSCAVLRELSEGSWAKIPGDC